MQEARRRGERGVSEGAKILAAKAASSVGVPPQVTRAAATLLTPVAKKSMAAVGVFLVMMLLITTTITASGGEDMDAEYSTVDVLRSDNDYMSSNLRRAYQRAAKRYRDDDYGGTVPWTLIASIAELATENGKVSPYSDDLCDRNPDQKLLRPKDGLSADACAEGPEQYPEVIDGIGLLEKQGVGPFLLSKRAARVANINAQALNAQGATGEPATATDYIAFELDRIRRDLIDNQGFAVPVDEATSNALWSEAVRRLPIADPRDAQCPTPPGGNPDANGQAIVVLWRCELRRSDGFMTMFGVSTDEDGKFVDELGGGEAVDVITMEALSVAWGFSGWGAANSDPVLCRPPADNPETEQDESAGWREAPADRPVGVFPLTKSVFDAYKAPTALDRCDPASNIQAAVNAFLDGEKVDAGQRVGGARTIGDRSLETGPFNPMVGGWWAMPWALGSGPNLDKFLSVGAPALWEPEAACRTAISTWLNVLSSQAGTFAALSNRQTTASGIAAPDGVAVVGDGYAAAMAPALASGLSTPELPAHIDAVAGRTTAQGAAAVSGMNLTPGSVLIVDLGSSDPLDPAAYKAQIDSLMAVALDARVVWLSIAKPGYEAMNAELRLAKSRHPRLDVVDAGVGITADMRSADGSLTPAGSAVRAALVTSLVSVGDVPPPTPAAPATMDAAALDAVLSAAGPRPYGESTSCAGAPPGELESFISSEAADLSAAYALPLVADAPAALSEPGEAVSQAGPAVAGDEEPVGEEHPALPLPTEADHERARLAANLDGIAIWFQYQSATAPESVTGAAVPGEDSMVLRLSSTGRRLEGMPPTPLDQARESYSKAIVDLAVAFGGIMKDDPRFDREANPFEEVDGKPGLIASFFAAAFGGAAGGIYNYSIEGMTRPKNTDFAWGGFSNGQIPATSMVPIPGTNGPCVDGIAYPSCLHPFAAQSWAEMIAAAAGDGVTLGASAGSAYRTYAIQLAINSNGDGIKDGTCCTPAARPGTSNHGWGMAIDMNNTPAAVAWLRANARAYGWVEDVPGENWHWAFWAGAKWAMATGGGFGPWPERGADGMFGSGGGGTMPAGTPFAAEIQAASTSSNVPVGLLVAQLRTESGFADDVIYCRRMSTAGARGIAQFMPATAAGMGIDPCDPLQAIPAQARLMRSHYDRYQSWALSLAAYNAGSGNVAKHCGVPPFAETMNYVEKILSEAGMPDDRRRLC